ncbi:MAG: diguanylate cyclase [Bdellovibrionaceae bacterium]|jgi:two-component system cell cycle response regulator|nr:diguanylate cyclase [Pseudobdellovibrionaceae bacterium]
MSQTYTRTGAQARRILIIDEDPESLEHLLEPIRWENYDTRGVTDMIEAIKMIENWNPHIVLLDLSYAQGALQALEKIQAALPHTSVILISEDSSTDSIIVGLDAGADDYIVKPFVPLELLARVRTQLRIRDLQEQLIYANEKLKELVDTDDLTGLYNMRSLYQRLEFEMERGRRFNRGVCVVMLDMDNFKSVNDGYDHLFGSFVIQEMGKIIKANTRNIDIPARYGGDEFLIVLTETTYEGILYFCERLRKSVATTPFVNGSDSILLTISLGFAITDPGEVISARDLVRRADHALYESKRNGRNRTTFFKTDSNNNLLELKKTPKRIPTQKKTQQSKKKIAGR